MLSRPEGRGQPETPHPPSAPRSPGDCCQSTCVYQPTQAGSCSLFDCRAPLVVTGKWVDTIPPTLVGVTFNVSVRFGSNEYAAAMVVPKVSATDNDLTFDGKVRPSQPQHLCCASGRTWGKGSGRDPVGSS